MNVDVLVYDGFDELDGIGPYEVFDYAFGFASENRAKRDEGNGSLDETADGPSGLGRIRYVTLDESEAVTASHGTRVGVDGVLPDPTATAAPDLLVVPG
ncbi:DJ-1/PfpI family protein, partial [Halorubrum pallidum]